MAWQQAWRLFYGVTLFAGMVAVWWSWSLPAGKKIVWLLGFSAVSLVIALILAWFRYRTAPHYNRRKIKQLGPRQPMSADEFYQMFYSQSQLPKEVVLELLKEVAESIEVPPTLLRPEDRFSAEMADDAAWGPDGGLAEVTFAAERREKRLGVAVDLSKIQTLDDYIRAFSYIGASRDEG
ncbi:hypothetical protein MYX77_03005 [Acidobacteriia bacterium AH_259_A11_L15]|nr:hypothetical protein [Acidobacteriia bacterium AH_259_A11_L15]